MKITQTIVGIAIASILVACGGGSSTTAAPTAEGFWNGTSGSGRSASGVVMDDGTIWLLYSKVGDSNVLGGAVQGASISNNGSFSSANAKDFNLEGFGTLNAPITGSYTARQSLNGTESNVSFSLTYDSTYEQRPSLADITGAYTGLSYGVGASDVATLNIAASGAISGSSKGCNYSGTVAPHAKGNIYDVSVTFGGGVCALGTSQVSGVVYLSPQKVIYALGLNTARTGGFIFSGTK